MYSTFIFLAVGFLCISIAETLAFRPTTLNSLLSSEKSTNIGNLTKRFGKDAVGILEVFGREDAVENVKYFADLFGTAMGTAVTKAPVVGSYTTAVELIYELCKKEEKDLFEQVEDKIRNTIRNELTKYHFDNMVSGKMLINAIVKEKLVDKFKWFLIKSQKYKFMPQLYRTIEYSKTFFVEWQAYTLIFVAATLDVIVQKKINKCTLVDEIHALSDEFHNGIKALQLKRWQMLEGTDSKHSAFRDDALYFEDRYENNGDICKDQSERACNVHVNNGPSPVKSQLDRIGRSVVNDAQDFIRVFNKIAESVAVGGKYCFKKSCGCGDFKLPTSFRSYIPYYPTDCMGTGEKSKKDKKDENVQKCELPCDKYGTDDNWCIVKQPTGGLVFRNNDYIDCKKPDWETCYKITNPHVDGDA